MALPETLWVAESRLTSSPTNKPGYRKMQDRKIKVSGAASAIFLTTIFLYPQKLPLCEKNRPTPLPV